MLDICEQLNISIPTFYRYLKYQSIILKADTPAYEVVDTANAI
ncbi:hypothetical protein [Candidatus Amoebophilus asiaticus]|nr:hypothetical protein [Candidatus Amoebophilus asiaticus]